MYNKTKQNNNKINVTLFKTIRYNNKNVDTYCA